MTSAKACNEQTDGLFKEEGDMAATRTQRSDGWSVADHMVLYRAS